MAPATATAIAQAAQAVEEAAREQKRAASFARRRSRELMQALDEFKRVCREQGINFTVNAQPEGGQSDGRRDSDHR